jgi:hypothetical protein
MTKKQDFIRKEQNRDKHPESGMKGSAAEQTTSKARSGKEVAAQDRQTPHSGKSANDHNKVGQTHPTQTNQGRRTPESRHDRQTTAGGAMNVIEARTGGKGGGRGSRGGNVGGSSS